MLCCNNSRSRMTIMCVIVKRAESTQISTNELIRGVLVKKCYSFADTFSAFTRNVGSVKSRTSHRFVFTLDFVLSASVNDADELRNIYKYFNNLKKA